MNNTINSVLTEKWLEVVLTYTEDNSVYENYEIFWEGMYFRFLWRDFEYACSKDMKGEINEDIVDMIFWNYVFDEEYDGDWMQEYNREKAENLKKNYYIYPINTYEHSSFAFSLWDWKNLRGKDWILLLDKKIFNERTNDEVNHFLRGNFTDFFNGRLYSISVFKPHIYTDDAWESITQRDYLDGISDVFWDDIEETYNQYFENEYWKLQKPLLTY